MARRTISVTQTVTIELGTRRGESFEGLVDLERLKKKLNGGYSLDMAANFPLYKWFPDVGEFRCYAHSYIPPDNIQSRKPAVTDPGLEELLIDNLPAWGALPDKKTAATSFSSRKTAVELSRISEVQGYHPGRIFRVIPVSGARIVVAPAGRFRNSFQYALEQWGISAGGQGSMGQLESAFYQLLYAYGMEDGYPREWVKFVDMLNDIAYERIRRQRLLCANAQNVYTKLIGNKTNLSEFLISSFSPANNGFKVIDYSGDIQPGQYPDNECWTASPCLLIDETLFDQKDSIIRS